MRRTKKKPDEIGNVSLIPVMNLVCLLIPFLLYTASFVVFAAVSTRAPRITPEAPRDGEEPPETTIALTITDQGFLVRTPDVAMPSACGGAVEEGPTFPLRADADRCTDSRGYPSVGDRAERARLRLGPPPCAYDFAGLSQCVLELKAENPEAERIVILGEPTVGYDVLIRAMDVTRGSVDDPIFSDVVLGSGVV